MGMYHGTGVWSSANGTSTSVTASAEPTTAPEPAKQATERTYDDSVLCLGGPLHNQWTRKNQRSFLIWDGNVAVEYIRVSHAFQPVYVMNDVTDWRK